MFSVSWEAVASHIKDAFAQIFPPPQMSKVVATVVSLEDFKKAFLSAENFLTLPCWKSITHLVVRDFLNISTVGDKVCVAGGADRFGWPVYKSLLKQLLEAHPNLTLVIEFHEVIGRDLMYGARRFPCCDVENFINSTFPAGRIGLNMRILNYISAINIDSGLGAALRCLASNMGERFSLWVDIENKHFSLTPAQMAVFDGVFMHRNSRLTFEQKKNVVIKIERPFIDAKLAYLTYAGMMTTDLFKDGADAAVLSFDMAQLDKLANPSMLNTCLKEWHLLAQQNPHERCSKCALPNNVCAVQSDAPGSCSKQTVQAASPSSVCSSEDLLMFQLDS